MSQTNSFYVTTPIYYVTDSPHIGNAYTTIAADCLARYRRLCGCDVHFLTGTDEHGLKVIRAAAAAGTTPRELADRVVVRYLEAWKRLGIAYDDFIRTTEERHERVVGEVFNRLNKAGDIYLGEYQGWYCVSCETFLKESDKPNPPCPECGRASEWDSEKSYFFRLSKYQKPLLDFYDAHPDALRPVSRRNEVLSRVREGLRDLSVTRTSMDWGVPVPFDPEHRAYVWVDALINYISAIGYPDDAARFDKRWPADVHLIGKDIIWFHSVIWPALLIALGLQPPKLVYAHGWWTHNGEKMSKSKGNFVDPAAVSDAYGSDALRYFVLRELPFGLDGDFRDAAMLQRYNAELAGDLGNLVYRTFSMMERYFGGVTPDPGNEQGGALAEASATLCADMEAAMSEIQFSKALERIWEFVRRANAYVEERKPWQQAKKPEDRPALSATLYHLAEATRILGLAVSPFMPDSGRRIAEQLGTTGDARPLAEAMQWGGMKPGMQIRKGEPLFPKKEA